MRKIYRMYIRIVQRFNYLIAKNFVSDSRFDINLVEKLSNKKNNRLPKDIVRRLSRGIKVNEQFPAGKTIEFITNSNILEVFVLYKFRRILNNMPSSGTSGLDIYINKDGNYIWKKCIVPNSKSSMYLKDQIDIGKGQKKVKIYFPSFAVIEKLMIKERDVVSFIEYENPEIVFYGSSISQGAAASRPGLCYINQVASYEKCSVANFGFSESAKGETSLIKYIAGLGQKIFVLEYDHNATINELKKSHLNAYKTIRKESNCWIIMMTRFSGGLSISLDEEMERVKIIEQTYQYAVMHGDNKIIFINGSHLFKENKNLYFVDKIHPNDDGMQAISKIICKCIDDRGMLKDEL